MSTPASTGPGNTAGATAGVALPPGAGRRIVGGGLDVTVKIGSDHQPFASTFEVVVPPGYDVLASEPVDRSVPDWRAWRSADGQRYLSGGPGAFLYVPPAVPHAFANTSGATTRVFFQSSAPGGYDHYFDELAEFLRASGGRPDPAAVADLRRRYDIEQLTDLRARR